MTKTWLKVSIAFFMGICLMLLVGLPLYAEEEDGQFRAQGETLKELGLFQGTPQGFELIRQSNRAEAAVMLVRLLGVEKEATQNIGQYKHPFKDVPSWVEPYVGYLYEAGLTKGTSTTTFGSSDKITPSQYATMLLRALHYKDSDGLYTWDTSLEYALTIDLFAKDEMTQLLRYEKNGLNRDYMVKMSYNSILTKLKASEDSLLMALYKDKVITEAGMMKAISRDPFVEYLFNEGRKSSEMRGVWISYLELQRLFKNSTKVSFQEAIDTMFKDISKTGLNTVIVQVRPFGDAIYPSKLFPWSYMINGAEGDSPGYDPFDIMVKKAHEQGLKIEAWINPYRIRSSGSKVVLSSDNIATKWLNDNSNRVLQIPEGVFYNPANKDAQNLIVAGVKEIIENYKVDGIHFDDYFYPSTDLSYDEEEYLKYLSQGGSLSQEDWRRENVNHLIKTVYQTIKSMDPKIQFGISPQADLEKNYENLYSDVEKWVTSSEYIDYICPQVYFGFLHETVPYSATIAKWNQIVTSETVKLYIGLAAYKLGLEDKWAGAGKNEWMEDRDILHKMVLEGRNNDKYRGFMLFRYDYLWQPALYYQSLVSEALASLKSILE